MRHTVELFGLGTWVVALAAATSLVGALLGLGCMTRLRQAERAGQRVLWSLLGAVSIGGVGIWLMQLMATLGFSIPGQVVRYDVRLTALSAAAAVGGAFLALLVGSFGGAGPAAVVAASLVCAAGVAGTHYLGMEALQAAVPLERKQAQLILFLVLAVVTATVIMFLGFVFRGVRAAVGTALLIAATAVGMQYAGMVSVFVPEGAIARGTVGGVEAFDFLMPVFGGGGAAAAVVMWALFVSDPRLRPAVSPAGAQVAALIAAQPVRAHPVEPFGGAEPAIVPTQAAVGGPPMGRNSSA